MKVMDVAMALVCAGSVTFLLSVLIGLIREAISGPPLAVKALLTKFVPPRALGELIVMTPKAQEELGTAKNPSRIALIALAALGLSLTAHGQKMLMGPSVSNGNESITGV